MERGRSLLHAQVAILLHFDAFDIGTLLGRVLELAFAAPVHSNLTVALHLELDRAILAKQALACEKPLAITESVVRHIEYGLEDVKDGQYYEVNVRSLCEVQNIRSEEGNTASFIYCDILC
jgi:hypothetical protein